MAPTCWCGAAPRGVSLTPIGQLVLERARRLLSDEAELTHLVRGNGTDLVGPLVVGCFVTLAPTVPPRLLADFEELHPLVTLDFVERSPATARSREIGAVTPRPPFRLECTDFPAERARGVGGFASVRATAGTSGLVSN